MSTTDPSLEEVSEDRLLFHSCLMVSHECDDGFLVLFLMVSQPHTTLVCQPEILLLPEITP